MKVRSFAADTRPDRTGEASTVTPSFVRPTVTYRPVLAFRPTFVSDFFFMTSVYRTR